MATDPAPDLWDDFAREAACLGAPLTPQQIQQFRCYLAELAAWNQRFNLTRIIAPQEVLVKHFLDSLTCARVADLRTGRLLDVGTGAGFPGVPLKIAFPALSIALLDSVGKKVRFVERLVGALQLEDVMLLHTRAEVAAHRTELREQFDVVTARAVASLDRLAGWLLPFARQGGVCIAMKGPEVEQELRDSLPAIRVHGGGEPRSTTFTLPLLPVGRSLVGIPKARATPPSLPRGPAGSRPRVTGA